MAYEFTFTSRFQKHFKDLTAQEKRQLKNKLELLAQNLPIRHYEQSVFKGQQISLNVASIWIFALSGIMRETK